MDTVFCHFGFWWLNKNTYYSTKCIELMCFYAKFLYEKPLVKMLCSTDKKIKKI